MHHNLEINISWFKNKIYMHWRYSYKLYKDKLGFVANVKFFFISHKWVIFPHPLIYTYSFGFSMYHLDTIIFALYEGLNKGLKKIQLLENKADSPKGNLLFALLFSSNKRLYA